MVLEWLFGSCLEWRDWHYLPPAIQGLIVENSGKTISREEVFSKKTTEALKRKIAQMIEKEGLKPSHLEALAFTVFLDEISTVIEINKMIGIGDEGWDPSWGDKFFLSPKLGLIFLQQTGFDCIQMCELYIEEIFRMGTGKFGACETEKINFVSAGRDGNSGESQNMVCLKIASDLLGKEPKMFYLVDVAAYCYHPGAWAKAFAGPNYQEVLHQGVEWLNKADSSFNWMTASLLSNAASLGRSSPVPASAARRAGGGFITNSLEDGATLP